MNRIHVHGLLLFISAICAVYAYMNALYLTAAGWTVAAFYAFIILYGHSLGGDEDE